jgi:hydroxybutyrate-dimer hydrolase
MENRRPGFLRGDIQVRRFNGIDDDLLTGGFGARGLSAPPPETAGRTPESLRRMAIFWNYRGLVDVFSGFGELYGPNIGPDKSRLPEDGKIAGTEFIAYTDEGRGRQNVVLMVQIPAGFDPKKPRIIAGTSSGSRGIYGAVGAIGDWGLKRGFAVAYSDKGTGNGIHDLSTDTVFTIDGRRVSADEAGIDAHFNAEADPAFIADTPHRIAFKHAHSKQNPQADWGLYVRRAIIFALYVLNLPETFGTLDSKGRNLAAIVPESTTIIAAGISNGGDAAVRAAEGDTEKLIDGVCVSEPNLYPETTASMTVIQGDREWTTPEIGQSILEVHSLLNVYQPCACIADEIRESAPLNRVDPALGENRCLALKEKGLLAGDDISELAAAAQKKINDAGVMREQNLIAPSHHFMQVSEGIAVTYAGAYGRFGVEDSLCGYGFAGVDDENRPAPLPAARLDRLFAEANGIAPTGGIAIINENSRGGPAASRESVSDTGRKDQNLAGALALRRLILGVDESGAPLQGEETRLHDRIRAGMKAVAATGNLGGRPAVIVHGRTDAILSPNHTSRPYAVLNRRVEGESRGLRYYEITGTHHLDFLNRFPGFNARYVPLLPYFFQALDLLLDHLENRSPLPGSQVVRTRPRGIEPDGTVPPLTQRNLPPIQENPPPGDRIHISADRIRIPE